MANKQNVVVEVIVKSPEIETEEQSGINIKESAESDEQQVDESKSGARHSISDSTLIKEVHDLAMRLGAKCDMQNADLNLANKMKAKFMGRLTNYKSMDLRSKYRVVQGAWDDIGISDNVPDGFMPDGEDWYNLYAISITDDTLIAENFEDLTWAWGYNMDDAGVVTFGLPVQVQKEYIPVEAVEDEPQEPEPPQTEFTPKSVKPNILKSISVTDDELRVGNYIMLWGGRDLEGLASNRKNGDGSHGEFFTQSTNWKSDYTDTGRLYVDWEHGHDPDQNDKGVNAPNRDNILGYVDIKSMKADPTGLWVERVLNRRNRYVNFLEELIDAGLIGTSSEPVQNGVTKSSNGQIGDWPLKRDTLTVSPMEPRMLGENTVIAIKGLANASPEFKNICIKAGILPKTNDDTGDAGALRQAKAEAELLMLQLDIDSQL